MAIISIINVTQGIFSLNDAQDPSHYSLKMIEGTRVLGGKNFTICDTDLLRLTAPDGIIISYMC